MELKEVLRTLKQFEVSSLKKGYGGDAINWASKRFTLLLLSEIAQTKKRTPSDWNLFVGKYLRQGKTLEDAARDWAKKSKSDRAK